MFQNSISKQDRWTPNFLPVPIIQPRPIQLIRQNSHRTSQSSKRYFLNFVFIRSNWFQWFFLVVPQVWSAPVWLGSRFAPRCSRLWRSSFALTQPSQFRSSWSWLRTAPTPVVSVGLIRWQFSIIFQHNMDTSDQNVHSNHCILKLFWISTSTCSLETFESNVSMYFSDSRANRKYAAQMHRHGSQPLI